MAKNRRIELVCIDPQNDFCDKNGSLFVNGADQDCIRLADMIIRLKNKIDDIHVTLDSHHLIDVAHPIYWIDSNGKHPEPFTLINSNDLKTGKWRTTNPVWMNRSIDYVQSLESNGKYVLCIWPPHCLIGTWGHNIVDSVAKALLEWENDFAVIDYVTKGSNLWTEHYGAVEAEVPDMNDPGTMLNTQLITTLQNADVVLLTGQALSHCVANTVRQIADNFGEENIKKLVLIRDTTSSVTGFENLGEDFVKEMTKRGMQISTSAEILS